MWINFLLLFTATGLDAHFHPPGTAKDLPKDTAGKHMTYDVPHKSDHVDPKTRHDVPSLISDIDPCLKATCGANEHCVRKASTNCPSPPCEPTFECLSSTRQGECPAHIPALHTDYGRCIDHCEHDIDCPRTEKCCHSPCGARVCVNAAEKPGQCPSLDTSFIGLCVAHCRTDQDCAGTTKCCGGCPRQCAEPINATEICKNIACQPGHGCHLAPVVCTTAPCTPLANCLITKKPGGGVCPIKPVPTSANCLSECTVDGQCPRDEICCSIGCHKVCREPRVAVPKRGKCPKKGVNIGLLDKPDLNCTPECAVDHDCGTDMKCCGDCGKCLAPETTVKPGKCPANPFSIFPMIGLKLRCKGRGFCSSDDDCLGPRKCCGECPKKCRNPVLKSKKKEMKCPAIVHVVNCNRSRVKKCLTSTDCRKRSMCCPSVTCGNVCVRVIRSPRTWWRG